MEVAAIVIALIVFAVVARLRPSIEKRKGIE